MFPSKLSTILNLNLNEMCYQLSERIIGFESLIFLKKQFEDLRPVLQSLIPQNKQLPIIDKFYQNVSFLD